MADWERVYVPPNFGGVLRAERRGGSYRRYRPDRLQDVSNVLAPEVMEQVAEVTVALAVFGAWLRANPMPALYATALRSESISSSWIEGVRASPREVAVAQIGARATSHTGALIVANISAMQHAIDQLGAGLWTHDHLWDIQHQLLPGHRRGYRTDQVWIGGTNVLNAVYAAPAANAVPALMDDLLTYANTSGDLPVVLAAVIHAQFETIHPFEDGNGRVGRALVHGVLRRAGLIEGGVIPLSTALRNDVPGYIAALTAYRYDGDQRAPALNACVSRFASYLLSATVAARTFADATVALMQRWRTAVAGVRADAAVHRALEVVMENPVVTTEFLGANLNVSVRVAEKLVQQLIAARILAPATGRYRRWSLYQANEVLALLAFGAEARPLARAPEPLTDVVLVQRCGKPTSKGLCGNRVPSLGERCWRHPG